MLKSPCDYYFDNLIKAKEKKIVDEKNFKNVIIYLTTYVHRK